jgi:hypothetical protein
MVVLHHDQNHHLDNHLDHISIQIMDKINIFDELKSNHIIISSKWWKSNVEFEIHEISMIWVICREVKALSDLSRNGKIGKVCGLWGRIWIRKRYGNDRLLFSSEIFITFSISPWWSKSSQSRQTSFDCIMCKNHQINAKM